MTVTPECPMCRVAMERGEILDRADWNIAQPATWVDEESANKFWKQLTGKGQRRVVTYRCPRCTMLISYAL